MNSDRVNEANSQSPALEVGEANFDQEVLKFAGPVLVFFFAHWSQPCHILKSVLDDLAHACSGRCKLVRVNVDENPELGVCYAIQSIPTLLYFIDGKVRLRLVGTVTKEAILSRLEAAQGSTESAQGDSAAGTSQ